MRARVSSASIRPTLSRLAGPLLCIALVLASCAPKGPFRPWVHKVYFHGIKQIKEKDVRPKISVQQTSWIPLAPKRYLEHPMAVEFDRARIVTYYQTRGFFSTKVTLVETKPYKVDSKKDPKSPEYIKAVDVHFTIDEGPPTLLSELRLGGLDALPPKDAESARKGFQLKLGDRFDHQAYLDAKERIMLQLHRRGYAFPRYQRAEVLVERDAHTAAIELEVDPGSKTRLGNVLIEGTQHVDPEALRKHAGIRWGEPYKPQTIDSLQGRLYNLGLFSTVLVEPVHNPDHPEIADVHIAVKEGKHRELRLGVGVGIEPLRNELHGELVYTQRRFLGGLRVFQFTFQPGYAALPAVWASPLRRHGPIMLGKGDFTQPDLLGKSSSLTLTLSYELGVQYAYQYHGPSLRLGLLKRVWEDHVSLAVSYNFQFLDFFAVEPGLEGDAGSGILFGFVDPYRLGFIQEQIGFDFRNRPIDATKGVYFLVDAEQGGVYTGSAFSYQKIQPEVRGYFSIGNRFTVAARIQFGHIFAQGDLGSPITQRFYLGGPNSHRGFTYNRLSYQMCSGALETMAGPTPVLLPCRDIRSASLAELQRLPTGGDTLLLGQLELRLGLFRIAKQWVTLAAFVDAGDVTPPGTVCAAGAGCADNGLGLDITKLHVAVGGGLRYRTVIGTIRFDLGVRLNRLDPVEDNLENPDPGERIAWHLSIGESF